jgi:hypothetical protein
MSHSSTLESLGFFDGVDLAGFADVLVLVEVEVVVLLADGVEPADGVVLAEVVAPCWSEGLLPSAASADPHAALVRSAAVTPAPRTYVLHRPGP